MPEQLSLLGGPTPPPAGLTYQPDVLSEQAERSLCATLEELRWEPIVIRGQAARRTARHFGLGYDYTSRAPRPGEPTPEWLIPVRACAARLARRDPEELVEALVQRYPAGSTIGWHRDAPAFGIVIGLSLNSPCRLRFQRTDHGQRRTWELALQPRSGYVLDGEARSDWEHAIPPTKDLRYSITFRTLRDG